MDAKVPATTLDPVILALTQNRLDHISHQMGWVMVRTARSPIFSQAHDFSCYIAGPTGAVVSQPVAADVEEVPLHPPARQPRDLASEGAPNARPLPLVGASRGGGTDAGVARFGKLVLWAFGISALSFFSIATFGFLTFGAAASGNVLTNYAMTDALASWARGAIALSLLAGYPFAFDNLRESALEALKSAGLKLPVRAVSASTSWRRSCMHCGKARARARGVCRLSCPNRPGRVAPVISYVHEPVGCSILRREERRRRGRAASPWV